jgi:hypothetical protein
MDHARRVRARSQELRALLATQREARAFKRGVKPAA